MMPSAICVISVAAFLQFFVLHCRSLLSSYRNVELSAHVREVTGVATALFAADDFYRLLQLVRLCPERRDDRKEIRVVGAYYGFLGVLRGLARLSVPRVAAWAEQERRNCSYFAAVVLDRRISCSRALLTQQVPENI
jgi:hypothetical protein